MTPLFLDVVVFIFLSACTLVVWNVVRIFNAVDHSRVLRLQQDHRAFVMLSEAHRYAARVRRD